MIVTLLCLLFVNSAAARQEIRFYKANKLEQTSRIWFTGDEKNKEGCHNLYKKKRVYQTNQIGFASCSLFAQKNCQPESILKFNRTKDETAVTKLSQGYSWFPVDKTNIKGVKVRSWSCEGKP